MAAAALLRVVLMCAAECAAVSLPIARITLQADVYSAGLERVSSTSVRLQCRTEGERRNAQFASWAYLHAA